MQSANRALASVQLGALHERFGNLSPSDMDGPIGQAVFNEALGVARLSADPSGERAASEMPGRVQPQATALTRWLPHQGTFDGNGFPASVSNMISRSNRSSPSDGETSPFNTFAGFVLAELSSFYNKGLLQSDPNAPLMKAKRDEVERCVLSRFYRLALSICFFVNLPSCQGFREVPRCESPIAKRYTRVMLAYLIV
jgi:hypothetical protein